MYQNVFIIGATGKVGSTLVRQMYAKGDTEPSRHANPTRIVGLASSSAYVFSSRGIPQKQALAFIKKKEGIPYRGLDELLGLARRSMGKLVFIDATALNEPMIAFHKRVITKTMHSIVTANKNPIAYSDYKTFALLTKEPGRYGYRCSVMAGAGAVPFLRDLRDLDDQLLSIDGCFSGTLGYIASGLEAGQPFSAILTQAWRRGYTEPDPRDDLNGLDVARKILVLARSAGYRVELSDVAVRPFIPRRYFTNENAREFLTRAGGLDVAFARLVRDAKHSGKTLRYVAHMQAARSVPKLSVGLRRVPKESRLGTLRGTQNKIIIVSKVYGEEAPYSIQAPGAGLAVTAQNIRRDLLYLLEKRVVAN